MSIKSENEHLNAIEKLSKNLSSQNFEVRERACNSILLKLQLNLIPPSILLKEYHFLIGNLLSALNQFIEKNSPAFIENVIQILRIFSKLEKGKDILREYGTVEFLGEFIEHQKKTKNGAILEETESFLFSLVNKSSMTILNTQSQTFQENSSEKKPPSLKKTHKLVTLQSIFNNLENSGDLNEFFVVSIPRCVSDFDKKFLTELTTHIKYTKKENINCNEALFSSIVQLLENFPIEIFCSSYTDLFYEVVKIILESPSSTISCFIYQKLVDSAIKELEQRITFKMNKNEKKESECETNERTIACFLVDSYPSFINFETFKNNDHIQKLSIFNIFETILRLYIVALKYPCFSISLTKKIKILIRKFFQLSENQNYSKKICLMLISSINFWFEVFTNGKDESQHCVLEFQFISQFWKLIFEISTNFVKKIELDAQSILLNLKNAFDFKKFIEWYVCGIFKETHVPKILNLLQKIDENIAKDFGKMIKITHDSKSLNAKLLQSGYSLIQNLLERNIFEERLSDAIRFVDTFYFLEFDISEFFQFFLVCRCFLRDGRSLKLDLQSNIVDKIKIFSHSFEQFIEVALFSEQISKTKIYLFKEIIKILNQKPKVSIFDKNHVNLEKECQSFLENSSFASVLMIAFLENSESLFNLNEKFVTEIFNLLLTHWKKLPESIDPFLLANFLMIFSEKCDEAKSLLAFVEVKFLVIDKIVKILNIYSKDVLKSYQSFNSLVFELKENLGLSSEIVKKMQLAGIHNESKISQSHHFFSLVDQSSMDLCYANPLKTFVKLSNCTQFVEPNRMTEIFDILDLFLNENLEKNIRQEALSQCTDAFLILRKNREARTFSSHLTKIAIERLMKEEVSGFTDGYLKIIIGFFMFQKYHSALKAQFLQKIQNWLISSEFKPIQNLFLSILKSTNTGIKFNVLCFVQLFCFSSFKFDYEYLKGKKMNKSDIHNKKKQSKFNEQQDEEEMDNFKIDAKFLKFNKNGFVNFLENKHFDFSTQILLKSSIDSKIVKVIQKNQGHFFNIYSNLSEFFESSISTVKKQFFGSISVSDLIQIFQQLIGLVALFKMQKRFIEKEFNVSKIEDNIKAILEQFVLKIKPLFETGKSLNILFELLICCNFCFVQSKKIAEQTYLLDEFFSFIFNQIETGKKEQIQNSMHFLANWSTSNQQICQFFLLKYPFQFERLVQQYTDNNNIQTMVNILDLISNEKLKLAKNTIKEFVCRLTAKFESCASFYDSNFKIKVFQLTVKLFQFCDESRFSEHFELFLRTKEVLSSPIIHLRMLGWLQMYYFSKKCNDEKFIQEIFFMCKEKIENDYFIEHEKIRVVVLSVLGEIFSGKKTKLTILCDFSFLKKIKRKMNSIGKIESAAMINLLLNIANNDTFKSNQTFLEISKYTMNVFFSEKIQFCAASQKKKSDLKQTQELKIDIFTEESNWKMTKIENLDAFKSKSELKFIFPLLFCAQNALNGKILDTFLFELDQTTEILNNINQISDKNVIKNAFCHYFLFLDSLLQLTLLQDEHFHVNFTNKLVEILFFLNQKEFFTNKMVESTIIFSILDKLLILLAPEKMSQPILKLCVAEFEKYMNSDRLIFTELMEKIIDFLKKIFIAIRKKECDQDFDELSKSSGQIISKIVQKLTCLEKNEKKAKPTNSFLIFLLNFSNEAKLNFLASSFIQDKKREINEAILEKDSTKVCNHLKLLVSLFFPVESSFHVQFFCQKTTTELSQKKEQEMTTIKENLKTIFLIMKKIFSSEFQENENVVNDLLLQTLTNWHLNSDLSRFLEKQTLKNDHQIFNSIIESLKSNTRTNSHEFVSYLQFLRKISSVEFMVNQVCKSKIISTLSSKIMEMFKTDKKNQLISAHLKTFLLISDLYFAYSFNKQSHPKIFENKQTFEAFSFFYLQIFARFKVQKKQKIEQELFDQNVDTQNNQVSSEMTFTTTLKRFLILFSNLLLTTSSKSLILESPEIIQSIFDCVHFTTNIEDKLLVSQFLYNMIYKDGSAIKILQKEQFQLQIEDLYLEIKSQIKKENFSVLKSLDEKTKIDEMREKHDRNLSAVRELILF